MEKRNKKIKIKEKYKKNIVNEMKKYNMYELYVNEIKINGRSIKYYYVRNIKMKNGKMKNKEVDKDNGINEIKNWWINKGIKNKKCVEKMCDKYM